MIERQVDGVAILTSEIDPRLLGELSDRRLPIVFLMWKSGRSLVISASTTRRDR